MRRHPLCFFLFLLVFACPITAKATEQNNAVDKHSAGPTSFPATTHKMGVFSLKHQGVSSNLCLILRIDGKINYSLKTSDPWSSHTLTWYNKQEQILDTNRLYFDKKQVDKIQYHYSVQLFDSKEKYLAAKKVRYVCTIKDPNRTKHKEIILSNTLDLTLFDGSLPPKTETTDGGEMSKGLDHSERLRLIGRNGVEKKATEEECILL